MADLDDAPRADWTALLASAELGCGEIRSFDLGCDTRRIELVVWRTAGGSPVVMDARCPHQWSHLEAEGVVDGEEIVCTAHFWRFDGTGRGCKLSMFGRRDEKAPIRVYPVREQGGHIEAQLPS
jgi:nitrite reductase/ring-hydroxylating ferredoxin subunit